MKFLSAANAATTFPAIGAAVFCLISAPAIGAGFALNEMSATGIGNVQAGNAALGEDLSTIYFNPAALTRLSGQQFMAVGSAVHLSSEFRNRGSLSATGAGLTGGEGGNAGSLTAVPALYYANDIRPGLRAGIGLHVPFGLKTDYDGDWAGRYQALKSELRTININPTLAYKLNEQVSIGVGLSAQYIDVALTRAIDFGSICVGTLGPAACVSAGYLPQAKDGKVKLDGSDWGFGFNLGVLYEPQKNARIGIAYRSKISHELSGGRAIFSRPAGLPAPLAQSRAFSDTGARADIDLPESISVSGVVNLDDKWSVLADINWMRWSRFKELRVRFDNGAPDNVTPQQWRDTVRVSAAVNYRYNDLWKLRAGIGYDQTPVKEEFRNARIPDTDRTILGFGAQFKPSRRDTWDIGYYHLFMKDGSINHAEPPVGGALLGTFENSANVFSVQYSRQF